MMYREIIAVCSQIHTKHINTLCGQNVGLLGVKLAVRAVITVNVDDRRLKYLAFEFEFKMYNSYRIALYYMNSKYSQN
jgi:membrane protein CcdC involved in cytochrome C biogenesis